jgi:hypothetical protein
MTVSHHVSCKSGSSVTLGLGQNRAFSILFYVKCQPVVFQANCGKLETWFTAIVLWATALEYVGAVALIFAPTNFTLKLIGHLIVSARPTSISGHPLLISIDVANRGRPLDGLLMERSRIIFRFSVCLLPSGSKKWQTKV